MPDPIDVSEREAKDLVDQLENALGMLASLEAMGDNIEAAKTRAEVLDLKRQIRDHMTLSVAIDNPGLSGFGDITVKRGDTVIFSGVGRAAAHGLHNIGQINPGDVLHVKGAITANAELDAGLIREALIRQVGHDNFAIVFSGGHVDITVEPPEGTPE